MSNIIKIIKPSVKIINEHNPLKKIELCGRVCYKSEDKITDDSAENFVKMIVDRGHTSVLEHVQYKVTMKKAQLPYAKHIECKYNVTTESYDYTGNIRAWQEFLSLEDAWALACNSPTSYGVHDINEQFKKIYPDVFHSFNYEGFVSTTEVDEEIKVVENDRYMSVRFICDRGVSHELVRHRVLSFSQESTRYCNYNGKPMQFIKPCYWDDAYVYAHHQKMKIWTASMDVAANTYSMLINTGASPQEARSVLPNSLKTEIIATGTYDEWVDVFGLRMVPAAHPQMQEVMKMLYNELKSTEHPLYNLITE